MLGQMQDWPLLLHKIIDYAALQFGEQEIVTRSVEGPLTRTTYAQTRLRALRLAQALAREGIRLGDRVATLAWNTARHLECWYGISGIGAIYHTVNPRLFPEQILWILNHAEDRLLFTDATFVPLLEKLADRLPWIERYVVLTDASHMPATTLREAVPYESWLAEADGDFRWAEFDEKTAAGLCYTSGTTGNPKGVLYSHRSNTLQSLALMGADKFALGSSDCCLPVVPLFHANAWSLAFSCPMVGAKMVMPGPRLDGASLYELLETEQVTFSAAVPTIWLGLMHYLERENKSPSTLRRLAIGGSACPAMLIERFEKYGVEICHAWGMTEMSPVGTVGTRKPRLAGLTSEERLKLKEKQGYAFFGVEMKITDDEGRALPWDGKTFGRLKTRGFAVIDTYFRDDGGPILDAEGFFDTGDVATIDPDGYMQITDRAKDVIKSGGEWISSIEIENVAVGHPDVGEAAVIGMGHARWGERPLLIIMPKPGCSIDKASLLRFLEGRIAKWWLPDDVQIVAEIPHTATGKINKLKLRELFKDYRWPQ
jgi:fatty-acyl-CoA synthase